MLIVAWGNPGRLGLSDHDIPEWLFKMYSRVKFHEWDLFKSIAYKSIFPHWFGASLIDPFFVYLG